MLFNISSKASIDVTEHLMNISPIKLNLNDYQLAMLMFVKIFKEGPKKANKSLLLD